MAKSPGVSAGIVGFGSDAQVLDVGPAAGEQVTTGPSTDADSRGGRDIDEVLRSFRSSGASLFTAKNFGGGTDFDAAIGSSNRALDGRTGENIVFFLSDGQGNLATGAGSPLQTAVERGTTINTFAVGTGTNGCATGESLRVIADATMGTCTEVTDPTKLGNTLLGSKPANIDRVEVARGTDAPVRASLDALGNWDTTLPGIIAGANPIAATVFADDGTKVTATITVNGSGAGGLHLVELGTNLTNPVTGGPVKIVPCAQAATIPVVQALPCTLVKVKAKVRLGR